MKDMWQLSFELKNGKVYLGEIIKTLFGYRWKVFFHDGSEVVLKSGRSGDLYDAMEACDEFFNSLNEDNYLWTHVLAHEL